MSARHVGPLAVTLTTAALVIACSAGPGPAGPTQSVGAPSVEPASPGPSAVAPSPSNAAAALLLKVTSEGGFINPVATLNALPLVEVYSDGRILEPGPVPAIAPGPLLPTETVRSVGAGGAAQIAAAIRAAGLDQTAATGPGIPGDSGTDVFSVTLDGKTTITRISGNGPGVGRPGGEPGVGASGGSAAPGGAAGLELLGRLLDPGETWGAAGGPDSPYQPKGYRVFAAPGAPQTDPALAQQPVAWPLSTGLASFGTPATPDRGVAGLRQGAVVGADAKLLGPILERASQATGFTSDGGTWTLYVRPLLPDELGG
jgi:hypothetical protein